MHRSSCHELRTCLVSRRVLLTDMRLFWSHMPSLPRLEPIQREPGPTCEMRKTSMNLRKTRMNRFVPQTRMNRSVLQTLIRAIAQLTHSTCSCKCTCFLVEADAFPLWCLSYWSPIPKISLPYFAVLFTRDMCGGFASLWSAFAAPARVQLPRPSSGGSSAINQRKAAW
jgi:hypothetical protein